MVDIIDSANIEENDDLICGFHNSDLKYSCLNSDCLNEDYYELCEKCLDNHKGHLIKSKETIDSKILLKEMKEFEWNVKERKKELIKRIENNFEKITSELLSCIRQQFRIITQEIEQSIQFENLEENFAQLKTSIDNFENKILSKKDYLSIYSNSLSVLEKMIKKNQGDDIEVVKIADEIQNQALNLNTKIQKLITTFHPIILSSMLTNNSTNTGTDPGNFQFCPQNNQPSCSPKNYDSLKVIKTLTSPQQGDIYKVLFFENEQKYATISADGSLALWKIQINKPYAILSDHKGYISNIISLSNGNLATASKDRTIKIWDPISATCIKTLTGHSAAVNPLLELPKNIIVSGSSDNTIRFWDYTKSDDSVFMKVIRNSKQSQCYDIIMISEQLIACGSGNDINIYNSERVGDITEPIKILTGHKSLVLKLILVQGTNYEIISASDDKTLKIWDWNQETCIKTLVGHQSGIYSMTFFKKNLLVSAGEGDLIFWEIFNEKPIKCQKKHKDLIWHVTTLKNGSLVSCGKGNLIKFWS